MVPFFFTATAFGVPTGLLWCGSGGGTATAGDTIGQGPSIVIDIAYLMIVQRALMMFALRGVNQSEPIHPLITVLFHMEADCSGRLMGEARH